MAFCAMVAAIAVDMPPPRITSVPQKCRLAKSISWQNAVRWRILSVIFRNAFDFALFSGDSFEKRHRTDMTDGIMPSSGNRGLVAFHAALSLVPTETPFKPLKTAMSPFCNCLPFAACAFSRKHSHNAAEALAFGGGLGRASSTPTEALREGLHSGAGV